MILVKRHIELKMNSDISELFVTNHEWIHVLLLCISMLYRHIIMKLTTICPLTLFFKKLNKSLYIGLV